MVSVQKPFYYIPIIFITVKPFTVRFLKIIVKIYIQTILQFMSEIPFQNMLNITVVNNNLREFRIILVILYIYYISLAIKSQTIKIKERLFLQDNQIYINVMTLVQLSVCDDYFSSLRASFSKITKVFKIY